MNQKNSLGLNICFKDEYNPIVLFKEWYLKAKKSEINDPNAVAIGTVSSKGYPTVRMVLLKEYNDDGFIFYTNFNSDKSKAIKKNPKVSMCFHWKSLQRQVRILGNASRVSEKKANDYFNSRSYGSKIGAWASDQSSILKKRGDLIKIINQYKKKFANKNEVPRPRYWSGWKVKPNEIEFWLDGDNRIHERLKYLKKKNKWKKFLLNP